MEAGDSCPVRRGLYLTREKVKPGGLERLSVPRGFSPGDS